MMGYISHVSVTYSTKMWELQTSKKFKKSQPGAFFSSCLQLGDQSALEVTMRLLKSFDFAQGELNRKDWVIDILQGTE